jgi:uncharacterized protein (UPF0147 family)
MTKIDEVRDIVNELCEERSMPKNVRSVLEDIKQLLNDEDKEIGVKVDSAIQMIEKISLDPNISSFARTQIWELSSALEGLLEDK